jgi:hypothetical protein
MGGVPAFLLRVAFFLVWITTPLVTHAFHGGWLLPLLGLICLPATALTYVLVSTMAGNVTGAAWLWVGLEFLLGVAVHSTAANMTRRRGTHSAAGHSASTPGQG